MLRAPSKPGPMIVRWSAFALGLAVVVVAALNGTDVRAQVEPEMFSYPVGLNPNGDNWVELRSAPSATEGTRLAKLGPDTLFTELRRVGDWVEVRLLSGDIGWVNARYVGCCRAATAGSGTAGPPQRMNAESCGDLWYHRNAIFKTAGYCFHSAQGIQTFGNAGCQFDDEADVPLSSRQREDIAEIQRQERYRGCQ